MRVVKVFAGILAALLVALIIIVYLWLPFGVWGMPFNFTRHGNPPMTPEWALECWVWEDDVNTAAFTNELVDGYLEHDFPLRTILIDSPWSTRYNDFQVDEDRFPNPEAFFGRFEEQGIRVVLWMTSMVDSYNKDTAIQDSSDWYQEAAEAGYLAGEGYKWRWWKGEGGFIDYTNPEAMEWWRGMQQQLFDWGVDGWKLDGTATFFSSWPSWSKLPVPLQSTHEGWMTTRGYMDHYYRDEYHHGLTQNPDFITLSRSLDRWAHPEGFAPIDASPVNWVGDQDHAWKLEDEGIEEALADILRSADMGYSVIGSDVAGYSGGEIPATVYIRWAQFSAFCGLFMNGGHGERRMWERSQQELELVREYSWLHTELIPYMYRYVVEASRGESEPLMRPMGKQFQYMFGEALLVAPIHEDSLTRTVRLPKGAWRYFFNDNETFDGPAVITRDFPIEEFPVFVREGSIIPLRVSRAYTGFGDDTSAGYLTWQIYPAGKNSFTMYTDRAQASTTLAYEMGEQLEVRLTGLKQPHILRIKLDAAPASVRLDGADLSADRFRYDEEAGLLIIRTDDYEHGLYRIHMTS